MKRYIAVMMAFALLAVAFPRSAQAQICTPSYPFELHLGQSACIQLCTSPAYNRLINFFLVGSDLGEAGVPVLSALPGCGTNTECDNPNCTPINPPTFFTQGGGVFFPDPDDWGGSSECMEIAYRWNHDGFWEIEIYALCAGCFCLSFDGQLSAELSSFNAVPGDNQVTVAWTTASETNMDRFDILRDGLKVHETDARNIVAGSSYSWLDGDVLNGITYRYTLVGVDMNGATEQYATINATPGSQGLVNEYALNQNFPNPFNPETNISFTLPVATDVSLRVFNLLGQEVATLVNGVQNAGTHVVSFDGGNLTSGVYIYRLEADGFSATRKMVLMK
ncbi:MAG: T9SS type A sorting domain-containing protein [Calditrichaeota bacterium]|nr:T9SS type A sorting domain-containing protein [Calditrichota bacterium]